MEEDLENYFNNMRKAAQALQTHVSNTVKDITDNVLTPLQERLRAQRALAASMRERKAQMQQHLAALKQLAQEADARGKMEESLRDTIARTHINKPNQHHQLSSHVKIWLLSNNDSNNRVRHLKRSASLHRQRCLRHPIHRWRDPTQNARVFRSPHNSNSNRCNSRSLNASRQAHLNRLQQSLHLSKLRPLPQEVSASMPSTPHLLLAGTL